MMRLYAAHDLLLHHTVVPSEDNTLLEKLLRNERPPSFVSIKTRDLSTGRLPRHGCWQNGILSSRYSQLFSQNTCVGEAITPSASGLCQEIRVIFHPRGHEESHQLGLACWWNDAKPSNLTGRKRKGPRNRRTSIKANSPAAFYPNHQSDWCWNAIDLLQTFRLYLFCTPAKRKKQTETHFRKKIKNTFIKCICTDPWTSRWATNSLAPRIKIKAASNVPVGRLAALWKQAFMCSGWQAFDVSSRVWD